MGSSPLSEQRWSGSVIGDPSESSFRPIIVAWDCDGNTHLCTWVGVAFVCSAYAVPRAGWGGHTPAAAWHVRGGAVVGVWRGGLVDSPRDRAVALSNTPTSYYNQLCQYLTIHGRVASSTASGRPGGGAEEGREKRRVAHWRRVVARRVARPAGAVLGVVTACGGRCGDPWN